MVLNRLLINILSKFYSIFLGINAFFTKVDYRNIPIVINNRNRLSFLKQLVAFLEKCNYKNIIIIDNKSTYPPLLEYYKTIPYKVLLLEENLGYKSLEKLPLYKEIRRNYFVYTDSDVVPVEECPEDFMKYFLTQLRKRFWVTKVGFSLKIDDLPECYDKKQQVIDWECQFFEKKIGNDYYAPIDTTFALHKPYALISTRGFFRMIRTGAPYEARHMPWYNDSQTLNEEEKYYIANVEIGTHWSKGIPLEEKTFIKRLFSKLMK